MKDNISDMLHVLNGQSLSDSQTIGTIKKQETAGDDIEVIVRKVITDDNESTPSVNVANPDEESIKTSDGIEIKVGTKLDDLEDGDGTYIISTESGEDVECYIEDGVVKAIGVKAIQDLTKKVVSGGKVKTKAIRSVKKRMSAAQKAALKKAQKKAHTAAATKKRVKSFKKGAAMGLHSSQDLDVSTVDLNELGDKLYEVMFETLVDNYEIDDDTLVALEDALEDDVCKPVVDGSQLKFKVPVWTELQDEVALDRFDYAELVYDLKGTFDFDSLYSALTEGSIQMQSSLII